MGYKVYFLLQDMKPVYIGHTKRHVTRILTHRDKVHNCVRIMPCKDKQAALYYEKRWQEKFKPKYNKNGVGKPKGTGQPAVKYNSKNVRIQFSLSKDEYDKVVFFANEQDRTVGNYISYSIIRALRNDSFFVCEILEDEPKLRIAR